MSLKNTLLKEIFINYITFNNIYKSILFKELFIFFTLITKKPYKERGRGEGMGKY